MKYRVIKPFDWQGQTLRPGEIVDIEDSNVKVRPLLRAKFIVPGQVPDEMPAYTTQAELPTVEQVVAEMEAEPISPFSPVAVSRNRPSPKEVVEMAKFKAT